MPSWLSIRRKREFWMPPNRGGFEFLGYHFEEGRKKPRKKSLKKFKDSIRENTKRNNGTSLKAIIEKLKPIIRGWFGYFKHSMKWVFKSLDGWIRRRLRSILRKRSKRRGISKGLDHNRWPNSFFQEMGLFSLEIAHIEACQSWWPPTGEPDAGNRPVRFGGREAGKTGFSYPYQRCRSHQGNPLRWNGKPLSPTNTSCARNSPINYRRNRIETPKAQQHRSFTANTVERILEREYPLSPEDGDFDQVVTIYYREGNLRLGGCQGRSKG